MLKELGRVVEGGGGIESGYIVPITQSCSGGRVSDGTDRQRSSCTHVHSQQREKQGIAREREICRKSRRDAMAWL